jgi:Zn-dependent protease
LHWSLLAIGGLLAFQLADGLLPDAHPGHSTVTYTAVGAAAAVVFFVAVLAHELAHALTARRYSMPVEGIDLWALGGVTRLRSAAHSPKAEWRIAAAGPLVSLLCSGVFGLAAYLLEQGPGPGLIPIALWWLAVVNAVLAVFNALPAAPLDGGRILSGVLWRLHGDRFRASQTAAVAGWMLGWLLVGLGVALTVRDGNGIFIGFLGLFLVVAARTEQHAAELRSSIAGRRAAMPGSAWPTSGETDAAMRAADAHGRPGVVACDDGGAPGYVARGSWYEPAMRRVTPRSSALAVPAIAPDAELDEELSDAPRASSRLPWSRSGTVEQLVGMPANDAVKNASPPPHACRPSPAPGSVC